MAMTSPWTTPIFLAVAGLSSAALSQVSLVIGSGASCIQPLLAKRPSQTAALGTKATSKALAEPAAEATAEAPADSASSEG